MITSKKKLLFAVTQRVNQIYEMVSEKSAFVRRNYYPHVQLLAKEFNKYNHFDIYRFEV